MDHLKNYNEVLIQYAEYQDTARKILNPSCRVCKVCNGIACAGRFTNSLEFGAKGNNLGFVNAYRALANIHIELDVIHDDYLPDTTIKLFGHNFDLPVFASPIAKILTDYTFESQYFNNNDAYADALVKGAYRGGRYGLAGRQ